MGPNSRPAKMRGMHSFAVPRPPGKAGRYDFIRGLCPLKLPYDIEPLHKRPNIIL